MHWNTSWEPAAPTWSPNELPKQVSQANADPPNTTICTKIAALGEPHTALDPPFPAAQPQQQLWNRDYSTAQLCATFKRV